MTLPASSSFRALAAQLRKAIDRGEYPRGSELPRQEELAERYGVTQSTVSKAMKVLALEGAIQPMRGKRTIVTAIPPIHRNPSLRYSRAARERAGARGAYDAEVRALGLEPRVDLEVSRATPPARVAELLGVPADSASTIARTRVMWADETITQLADSYVALSLFADTVLEQLDEGAGGMVSRMAELGHAQVLVTESTQARPATSEEARALGLSEDQIVYDLTHIGWTADDRAVEVSLHIMPAHLWILDSEFSID
jgi:GntR family transcriptional regulator